ncbi:MAG: hypothetical protein AAFV96_11085, partial [Pseudomonadota bacterium]
MSDPMDAWRKLAEKELKGRGPDDLKRETIDGITVKPLYTAADLEGLRHAGQAAEMAQPLQIRRG